jgi:hypothetical protein
MVLATLAVWGGAGCAPESALDEPARAPLLRAERPTAPVEFGALRIDVRPGEKVGDFRATLGRCRAFRDHLYWGEKIFKDVQVNWPHLAHKALKDSGYRLTADPDNLFASVSQYKQDAVYLLGARVTDLRLDICDHIEWFSQNPTHLRSGQAWMTVEWSVFSVIQERTTFRTAVAGTSWLARDGQSWLITATV